MFLRVNNLRVPVEQDTAREFSNAPASDRSARGDPISARFGFARSFSFSTTLLTPAETELFTAIFTGQRRGGLASGESWAARSVPEMAAGADGLRAPYLRADGDLVGGSMVCEGRVVRTEWVTQYLAVLELELIQVGLDGQASFDPGAAGPYRPSPTPTPDPTPSPGGSTTTGTERRPMLAPPAGSAATVGDNSFQRSGDGGNWTLYQDPESGAQKYRAEAHGGTTNTMRQLYQGPGLFQLRLANATSRARHRTFVTTFDEPQTYQRQEIFLDYELRNGSDNARTGIKYSYVMELPAVYEFEFELSAEGDGDAYLDLLDVGVYVDPEGGYQFPFVNVPVPLSETPNRVGALIGDGFFQPRTLSYDGSAQEADGSFVWSRDLNQLLYIDPTTPTPPVQEPYVDYFWFAGGREYDRGEGVTVYYDARNGADQEPYSYWPEQEPIGSGLQADAHLALARCYQGPGTLTFQTGVFAPNQLLKSDAQLEQYRAFDYDRDYGTGFSWSFESDPVLPAPEGEEGYYDYGSSFPGRFLRDFSATTIKLRYPVRYFFEWHWRQPYDDRFLALRAPEFIPAARDQDAGEAEHERTYADPQGDLNDWANTVPSGQDNLGEGFFGGFAGDEIRVPHLHQTFVSSAPWSLEPFHSGKSVMRAPELPPSGCTFVRKRLSGPGDVTLSVNMDVAPEEAPAQGELGFEEEQPQDGDLVLLRLCNPVTNYTYTLEFIRVVNTYTHTFNVDVGWGESELQVIFLNKKVVSQVNGVPVKNNRPWLLLDYFYHGAGHGVKLHDENPYPPRDSDGDGVPDESDPYPNDATRDGVYTGNPGDQDVYLGDGVPPGQTDLGGGYFVYAGGKPLVAAGSGWRNPVLGEFDQAVVYRRFTGPGTVTFDSVMSGTGGNNGFGVSYQDVDGGSPTYLVSRTHDSSEIEQHSVFFNEGVFEFSFAYFSATSAAAAEGGFDNLVFVPGRPDRDGDGVLDFDDAFPDDATRDGVYTGNPGDNDPQPTTDPPEGATLYGDGYYALAGDAQHGDWSSNAPGSLVSPPLLDNQSAVIRKRFQGPGTLSFTSEVSSEEGYDFFGAVLVPLWGGRAPVSSPRRSGVGAGPVAESLTLSEAVVYEVAWTYAKDSTESQGDDNARFYDVAFVPGEPAPNPPPEIS